jgi:ABC-type glutathione transport system ATPase component
MDNYQTIEKLRQMRLSAMAELHLQHIKNNKSNDATPDEYLALLTEHEWDSRQNQKVNRLIKQAGFKQKADIAGVDYTAPRNLDKNMFNRLATLDFIKRKENIIITGASGVGKSYLAQAIGHHACVTGDRVIYTNTARLFTRLKLSKTDGTYIKELIKFYIFIRALQTPFSTAMRYKRIQNPIILKTNFICICNADVPGSAFVKRHTKAEFGKGCILRTLQTPFPSAMRCKRI